MSVERLSMREMTKKYGAITVLHQVTFNVLPGEVHGLIGENGAGKSTLLNLLSGVREATEGEIYIDGIKVEVTDPLSARNLGIAMIHQELQNVPELSVYQNMFLGNSITKTFGLFVDKTAEEKRAREILFSLDPTIDPRVPIKELKVAQQQIVEIARALLDNAKIIAMDEPTSSLTPSEFERLVDLIQNLTKQGVSIIYVSHKMDELFRVCHRATILRDGKFVACVNMAQETEESIVTKMVGRKIEKVSHHSYATEETVLQVKQLSRDKAVKNATFSVNKGEVLGISGLVGSGRTELFRLIAGLDKPTSGEISVYGKPIKLHDVQQAIEQGIGLVPEDRKKEGILRDRSVAINMAMPTLKKFTNVTYMIDNKQLHNTAYNIMSDLNLRPLEVQRPIGTLSGGNQQKVVLGKALMTQPQVVFLDEPTRGIDVGAKTDVYHLIGKMAQQGLAVMFSSSELDEVMALADRILVMADGRITADVPRHAVTRETLIAASTPQD